MKLNFRCAGILSLFIIFILALGAVSAFEDTDATDETVSIESDENDANGIEIEENNKLEASLNGGTFEDIQAAIDDADDGDTIDLNGMFTGNGKSITVNKNLTIKGYQKTTLDAKKSSGIFFFEGQDLGIVIDGITFINSKSNAAIYSGVDTYGHYKVMNCNFNYNTDVMNLYTESVPCDIVGCNFTNNKGFSLWLYDANIKNCNFVENTGEIVGPHSIVGCSFTNNKVSHSAFIEEVGTVSNCIFKKNTGDESLIRNVQLVSDSKFIQNTLTASGVVCGAQKVTKSHFESNRLKADKDDFGGNGAVSDSKLVTYCDFKNNWAENSGAAIYYTDTVDHCNFDNNKAVDGGAIADVKSVSNCNFNNNYASYGGAIYNAHSVVNCKFTGNSVDGVAKKYKMGGGGAIYSMESITIDNCVFKNNKAKTSGSAIQLWHFEDKLKLVIKNSKFSGNSANGDFETVGYLFKNYGNGLIYFMGYNNFKATFKNCKGIGKNTKNKFKLPTKITVKSKKKYLNIKVTDKVYSNPLKGLKVKIKINGKTYKKKTNKNGIIKFSTKKFASKRYKVKLTYAGDNFMLKSSKTANLKFK